MLTPAAFEIYDVRTFKLVERDSFEAWSLVSPVLSHTTNGTLTYSDAVSEVAHSVRVYKGKIFLLVYLLPHNALVVVAHYLQHRRANKVLRSEHCSHGPTEYYNRSKTATS